VHHNIILKNKLDKLGILKTNEPLKNYTSFKTGGPADFLIWPEKHESLKEIIIISKEHDIPVTVLGGCTNLLVGDKGIRGITIMLNSASILEGKLEIEDNGLIYSDSMIRKDAFLSFCTDSGYEGMEWLAGIPGCIGGGIIMNAGTVDGNFANILESILYMDPDGRVITQKVSEEMAGYRKMNLQKGAVVLGGYFKLSKTKDSTGVRKKINTILQERKLKHPLDFPSAGSVFKNPDGHSSWKLINDSGLKGKTIGRASVSGLHTNFIINTGNATSMDILNLIHTVKETVFAKYQIELEPEIKILGEF